MTELILRLRDQMTLVWERLNSRQRGVWYSEPRRSLPGSRSRAFRFSWPTAVEPSGSHPVGSSMSGCGLPPKGFLHGAWLDSRSSTM